jgi:hypothetical protein
MTSVVRAVAHDQSLEGRKQSSIFVNMIESATGNKHDTGPTRIRIQIEYTVMFFYNAICSLNVRVARMI